MDQAEANKLFCNPKVQQLLKDIKEEPDKAKADIQQDEFLADAFKKLVAGGIVKEDIDDNW